MLHTFFKTLRILWIATLSAGGGTTAFAAPGAPIRGNAVLVCYPTDGFTSALCNSIESTLQGCGINTIRRDNLTAPELRNLGPLSKATPTFVVGHGADLLGEQGLGISAYSSQQGLDLMQAEQLPYYWTLPQTDAQGRQVQLPLLPAEAIENAIRQNMTLYPTSPSWEKKQIQEAPIWLMPCHSGAHFKRSSHQAVGVASMSNEETFGFVGPGGLYDPATRKIVELYCSEEAFNQADTDRSGIIDPEELRSSLCAETNEVENSGVDYLYAEEKTASKLGLADVIPFQTSEEFRAAVATMREKYGKNNVQVEEVPTRHGIMQRLRARFRLPKFTWFKREWVNTNIGLQLQDITVCHRSDVNGFYLPSPEMTLKRANSTISPRARAAQTQLVQRSEESKAAASNAAAAERTARWRTPLPDPEVRKSSESLARDSGAGHRNAEESAKPKARPAADPTVFDWAYDNIQEYFFIPKAVSKKHFAQRIGDAMRMPDGGGDPAKDPLVSVAADLFGTIDDDQAEKMLKWAIATKEKIEAGGSPRTADEKTKLRLVNRLIETGVAVCGDTEGFDFLDDFDTASDSYKKFRAAFDPEWQRVSDKNKQYWDRLASVNNAKTPDEQKAARQEILQKYEAVPNFIYGQLKSKNDGFVRKIADAANRVLADGNHAVDFRDAKHRIVRVLLGKDPKLFVEALRRAFKKQELAAGSEIQVVEISSAPEEEPDIVLTPLKKPEFKDLFPKDKTSS